MSLSLQEIFDKVISHLRKQGVQSGSSGDCLYRGPNGTMCAVGCLIKDEFYSNELEDMPADCSIVLKSLVSSGILAPAENGAYGEVTKIHLLSDLQELHDTRMCDGIGEEFEKFAITIAEQYELLYTPPVV